jgi:alpha-galactosidase
MISAPTSEVKRIELKWESVIDPSVRCLGDAWERAYADLGWKPLGDSGVMPWYFIIHSSEGTDGYGVMTAPAAMCFWKIDDSGVTLVADVRCGGKGVQLGNRTLKACTIVSCHASAEKDPLDVLKEFCHQMCPHPRFPKMPIYGFNDWNSTYGHNTIEHFVRDATVLAALAPAGADRPFMVVDDGWQANRQDGHTPDNPWLSTNKKFGASMQELADRIKKINSRPGLWYRPLEAWSSAPANQRLRGSKGPFDPSVPEVRARIIQDMQRFKGWGFEFVKHDYSTWEVLGRWGNHMGGEITDDGWSFADRSRTTAEILLDLYKAIREGGGDDMVIDGCNAISHLSAGVFETARIGDDTSGAEWDRNWKYGVNALAFRLAQNGTFYSADPDMVALAKKDAIPWEKNKQWLDLVSRSGMTLFVSWKVDLMDDTVKAAIREAYARVVKPAGSCTPVDWMESQYPKKWVFDARRVDYNW